MALSLVTAPTIEPVTLSEAKDACVISADDGTRDSLITALITAARVHVETKTHRALLTQTWDWRLQDFWQGWATEVPKSPLQSVTSISYYDTAGTLTTWGASNYVVTADAGDQALPGTIALASGVSWPSVQSSRINAVTVRFVAGYGATAALVPAGLRNAMLVLIAEMFAQRQITVTGRITSAAQFSFDNLIGPYALPVAV